MRARIGSLAVLVALASTPGCAASPAASGGTPTANAAATAAPRGSSDLLTAEEIATRQVTTAFDAVQQLRPQFLRGRGSMSPNSGDDETIAVYVDDVHAGSLNALRSIPAASVVEIRRISASDATTRFGTGHAGGVIAVRTRR